MTEQASPRVDVLALPQVSSPADLAQLFAPFSAAVGPEGTWVRMRVSAAGGAFPMAVRWTAGTGLGTVHVAVVAGLDASVRPRVLEVVNELNARLNVLGVVLVDDRVEVRMGQIHQAGERLSSAVVRDLVETALQTAVRGRRWVSQAAVLAAVATPPAEGDTP